MPSAAVGRPSRGRLGKYLTRLTRILTFLVVLVLGVTCWVAYQKITEERDGGDPPAAAPNEPSYSDLQIFDNAGDFGGTISIHNPLDRDVEVIVEVDIYDGEQNVGDMMGLVSLKPDSDSSVELDGVDDFVEYTDARVHLNGWAT